MSRKTPILILILISLLLCASGATLSSAVHAEETLKWWSVNEMLSYKKQVDEETDAICHGDQECELSLYYERIESNDETYMALDSFMGSSFIVSSINPSKNSISLVFQAEDPMLKRMGINKLRNLTEAYLFWLDDGMIGPAKDTVDIYNYSETVKSQVFTPGVHALLSKNTEIDGENWLPTDTEIEYSALSDDLNANQEGIIYFTVNASGSIIGLKDYSDCIHSPNYEDGMECRLMFNSQGSYAYIPIAPELPEIAVADSGMVQDQDSTNDETQLSDTSYDSANNNTATNGILPKTPNTGVENTKEGAKNNFPWWLVILIFLNSLPIIWLFWPDSQKSPKNSKKSIDKSIMAR